MKYINIPSPAEEYLKAARENYFIDKSDLISEVISAVEAGCPYLCVTRPRGFGKSYGANMVASFFSKADSMRDFFSTQKIGEDAHAMTYCGKSDVVYLRGDKVSREHISGEEYVELIQSRLISDLRILYPEADFSPDADMPEAFSSICEEYENTKLVFVVDEWDYLLSRDWTNEDDHKEYLSFLRYMLKDEEIIQLVYFTGVMPMPKTSDLCMFLQFTLNESRRMCTCFGFTEEEVDELYRRYCSFSKAPAVSREDLRNWCERYSCAKNVSIYNPQSVVSALTSNSIAGSGRKIGSDR